MTPSGSVTIELYAFHRVVIIIAATKPLATSGDNGRYYLRGQGLLCETIVEAGAVLTHPECPHNGKQWVRLCTTQPETLMN